MKQKSLKPCSYLSKKQKFLKNLYFISKREVLTNSPDPLFFKKEISTQKCLALALKNKIFRIRNFLSFLEKCVKLV